ncbi:hypothetical protein P692DRAFT_20650182, partial [Suillus brevipes Sb2]
TFFLQCAPVAETHAIAVTIEDEEESAEVLAITCSKAKSSNKEKIPVKDQQSQPTPTDLKKDTPALSAKTTANDKQLIRLDDKRTPAFTYESKAASPEATQRVYRSILDMVVPNLTVADLLAISPDLHRETVEHCRTQRIPA